MSVFNQTMKKFGLPQVQIDIKPEEESPEALLERLENKYGVEGEEGDHADN